MKLMKIYLVIPYAIKDLTQPHLAMPSLNAYLKSHGHTDNILYDLNIEFHDHFLSRAVLLRIKDKFYKKISSYDVDNIRYEQILLSIDHLVQNVEVAKRALRQHECYEDYDVFLDNYKIVEGAMQIVSFVEGHDTFDQAVDWDKIDCLLNARMESGDDVLTDYYRSSVVPKIKLEQPDLICLSVTYSQQVVASFLLAKMIKQTFPNIHIVMGGNYFSANQKMISETPQLFKYADSIIVLEGETAILRLIQSLEGSCAITDVPNLFYMSQDRVHGNESYQLQDMDELPTPDFDGLPFQKYLTPSSVLPLLTSRGCYWRKCAFCVHYYGYGTSFRTRSSRRILQDLKTLARKYHTKYFAFVDEAALPKVIDELSALIIRDKLDVAWYMESRFEEGYSDSVLKRMRDAGCAMMVFGLESFSKSVLDKIDKGTTPDVIKRVVEGCFASGIKVYVMVIVGLPVETRRDFLATLNFLKKYRDKISQIVPSRFFLNTDSKIFNDPASYNIASVERETRPRVWRFGYNYEVKEGATREVVDQWLEEMLSDCILWDCYPDLLRRSYVFFLKINEYARQKDYLSLSLSKCKDRILMLSKNTLARRVSECPPQLSELIPCEEDDEYIAYNLNSCIYIKMSEPVFRLLDFVDGKRTFSEVVDSLHGRMDGCTKAFLSKWLFAMIECCFFHLPH